MPSPAPESTRKRVWLALFAILVAWAFGVGARVAWHEGGHAPPPRLDGEPLLVTPDAFHYAAGVQQQLTRIHVANPRVPDAGDNVIIAVAAFMAEVFGISVEDACYWTPALLAPLVAVPLVLTGFLLGQLLAGFIAALIATIGFQFWVRTIPGYFDTDSVTVGYVFTVQLLLVAGCARNSARFAMPAGLVTALAPWMHPGSERILLVSMVAVLVYTLAFARPRAAGLRLTLALALGLAPIPVPARAALVIAAEIIVGYAIASERLRNLPPMVLRAGVGAALVAATVLAVATPAGQRVLMLLGLIPSDRGHLMSGLAFGEVASFVIEQRALTFSQLATLTAGHPILFATGLVGFCGLAWRRRPASLLVPLLVLGTAIAMSSVRYAIYATPVLALGNGIVACWLAARATTAVTTQSESGRRAVATLLALLLGAAPVAVALDFAARSPRVAYLSPAEAMLMRSIRRQVKPGDFTLSWWDTAYPLTFFTGGRALVDGMKHDEDLWIMAEILLSPSQRASASLARLAVEHQAVQPPLTPVIDDILNAWQQSGGTHDSFVPALREGRVELMRATRDVFLYLPFTQYENLRSMLAMRAVAGLLPEPERRHERIFAVTPILGKSVDVKHAWTYDHQRQLVIHTSGQTVPVHTVQATWGAAQPGQPFVVDDTLVNPRGRAWVIEHRHRNLRFILDAGLQASTWVQLVLLNRHDPRWFERIRMTPAGAIYRVRR
jgi:undecaprenyl-diphosphooligosaccharide--protein glycosyltransferase